MLPDKGPPVPPDCGRRLLPLLVDERAERQYDRAFASIPIGNDAAQGYRDVSYAIFANAVNRCAHWMTREWGQPSTLETVAYLAPSDLRYQIVALAATKAGYTVFLPSTRNTTAIFKALFEEAQVSKLLTTAEAPAAVSGILEACDVQKYVLPSLDDLLDKSPVEPIHLNVSFEEWRLRPFLQIHSSGSTGIPKLITLKHGSFAAVEAQQLLSDNEIGRRFGNMRTFLSFPPFHVAGLTYGLAIIIYLDSTLVLPPSAPLSADLCNSVHVHGSPEFSFLPPSLVVDLAKNQTHLTNLFKLKGICFAGGPLPDSIGNLLTTRIELLSGYGASEWNSAPNERKAVSDWAWFKFNCDQGGLEFRERDEGLYELVIVRKPEADLWQPVFVNFPDIQEFETKDLFVRHPQKPGLYRYSSRLDDVIVFSNGEKLNPVTMEGIIGTCPAVKGCVVVGQGRFQAALLVEPKDQDMTNDNLLEAVWPYVRKANDQTVSHGRITKELILFTDKSKAFPRAGKGTIQRAAANKLYSHEVDNLYQFLNATTDLNEKRNPRLEFRDIEQTKSSLRDFLQDEFGMMIGDDSDFFASGMDSLQVVNLVRVINASHPDDPLQAKHVYDNPSVAKLAALIHKSRDRGYLDDGDESDDDEQRESWMAMDRMFDDLTSTMTTNGKHSRRGPKSWFRSEDNGPVVPPDGGVVAWSQILGSFLINVNNWGLVNAFGVFQAYYETTLSESASTISWIGTLQGSLLLIVGTISGPLFDAGYFQFVLVAASVGLVFALMMLSIATQFWQILLAQGIFLGLCSGLLYIPSVALVPVYFKRRRGLALGLATGGGAFGGVIYPIIFHKLLRQLGFGWATRIMGLIALVALGSAIAIIRPLGGRTRRQLIDIYAFRDVPYVTFMVAAFLVFCAILVPFFLVQTFASTLEPSSETPFYLLAILNGAQFFGRLLPAWYTDKRYHKVFGPEALLFIAELLAGILGFLWIKVNSIAGYIPWLIFFGFTTGMIATLPAAVLPYISPNLAAYGTRLGMVYACAGVGFLISTPVASAVNRSTGSFLGSQIWTGVMCLAATCFFAVTAWEARRGRLLIEMGKNGKRVTARQQERARKKTVLVQDMKRKWSMDHTYGKIYGV